MAREKRDADLVELNRRAREYLEQAEDLEPRAAGRHRSVLLRLWHYPAFAVYRSWTLLVPHRSAEAGTATLVREVTWDRPHDCARLLNPLEGLKRGFHTRPELVVRDAELDAAELGRLLETGGRIQVPLVGIEECLGLDGEGFGLASDGFLGSLRLEWWCDGPAEWQALIHWAAQLREFVCRSLDNGTTRG